MNRLLSFLGIGLWCAAFALFLTSKKGGAR
jgi:hypothetical protein